MHKTWHLFCAWQMESEWASEWLLLSSVWRLQYWVILYIDSHSNVGCWPVVGLETQRGGWRPGSALYNIHVVLGKGKGQVKDRQCLPQGDSLFSFPFNNHSDSPHSVPQLWPPRPHSCTVQWRKPNPGLLAPVVTLPYWLTYLLKATWNYQNLSEKTIDKPGTYLQLIAGRGLISVVYKESLQTSNKKPKT